MGQRGPAKKPTQLKIIQGNPGKRKLNEDEPQFESCDAVMNRLKVMTLRA